MNREEVIEKALFPEAVIISTTNTITEMIENQCLRSEIDIYLKEQFKYQLDKLLNLCYPCAGCKGEGWRAGYATCPTCKGTGKGSPMIAVLAEEQELPESPYESGTVEDKYYKLAQYEMITPKDGAVWKKVIV